jgi:hypothetical protein
MGVFRHDRYDIEHPDVEPPNVSGHILDLAGFYMGKHRPAHMSEIDYERYITGAGAAVGKAYAALVDTYALADAWTPVPQAGHQRAAEHRRGHGTPESLLPISHRLVRPQGR